jgi:hypothetical protein
VLPKEQRNSQEIFPERHLQPKRVLLSTLESSIERSRDHTVQLREQLVLSVGKQTKATRSLLPWAAW